MDLLEAMIILQDIEWIDFGEGVKMKLSPFIRDNPPILDWVGVEEGGKEVPYSKENAIMFLTKYKHFADFVFSYTGDRNQLPVGEIKEGEEKRNDKESRKETIVNK